MNTINNWIKSDYWRFAFFVTIAVTLVVMIRLTLDAGYSGDEDFHVKHAKAVYDFYATGGKDTAAVTVIEEESWNLPLYGQAVDNIAYVIHRWFGFEDLITVRHITNVIFGWTLLLFGGLIAVRVSGKWRTALIVALLLFLSPRLLGHTFNNTKDNGFAAGMLFGLYAIIVFIQDLPKVRVKSMILLVLSIGFAIASRIGGLLLIPYLGLFAFIYFIKTYSFKGIFQTGTSKIFLKIVFYGLLASLLGYGLALLVWPYVLVSPIKHTIEIFKEQSHFSIGIRQLFEGSLQWSDHLPAYYTPKYILMTIPVAVIIGLVLFFIFQKRDFKNWFWNFVIFFSFFFPVFWIVYTNANVYGGWRHALFSYPPMVVAAGMGFNQLIEWVEDLKRNAKGESARKVFGLLHVATLLLPPILLIPPLNHIIKNHPYEYVYFNEFAGGVNKAYGNYELDYYYHSSREICEWVLNNAEQPEGSNEKIKVVSWHPVSLAHYFRKDTTRFSTGFVRWYEKGNSDWDYAVFTITGMAPEQLTNSAIFPPPNTVYTVKVDDVPIAIVLKRQDKSDFIGYQYKQKQQWDSAVVHLTRAIELDPTNEAAHVNLIESYFQLQQLDSAKIYIDKLVAMLPKYEPGNYFLAHYYLAKNQPDKALDLTKKIIKDNLKFSAAYHLQFQIYVQKNDLRAAEKSMIALMKSEQFDQQAMQQLLSLYKAQGIDDRNAYRKIYRLLAKTYENLGKKDIAQQYRDALKQL